MSGWKELLLDMLKLTDEVKRLNKDIERLEDHVVDVDKRVVRVETLVEVVKLQTRQLPDGG